MVSNASCDASASIPLLEYDSRQWLCRHRVESSLEVIKLRKAVKGNSVSGVISHPGPLGFARGQKGYFIVNLFSNQELPINVQTGMEQGTYCDVLGNGNCATQIKISQTGMLKITLRP